VASPGTEGSVMDEAVEVAFKGLSAEVGQVRHDISVLRDDFSVHIIEDRRDIGEIKTQVDKWYGAITLVGWILGIGVPCILGALVAHVLRHW
jgi:hypothetical protein